MRIFSVLILICLKVEVFCSFHLYFRLSGGLCIRLIHLYNRLDDGSYSTHGGLILTSITNNRCKLGISNMNYQVIGVIGLNIFGFGFEVQSISQVSCRSRGRTSRVGKAEARVRCTELGVQVPPKRASCHDMFTVLLQNV